jgi:hypothetical protein
VARPGTFAEGKLEEFTEKDVEVTGTVELYQGNPQIVLQASTSIRIAGTSAVTTVETEHTTLPTKPVDATFQITAMEIDLNRKEIRAAGKTESGFSPTQTQIAYALPANFKPSENQRILAVFPDFSGEDNLEKMLGYYAKAATDKGWVVLTAHSATMENNMPPGWFAAMISAAIRHLESDHPGASQWPIYLAGSSEGASRASRAFGALLKEGYQVSGCFLNSFKREEFTRSIREFDPSKIQMKRMRVFICHGEQDTFVTEEESLEQAEAVKQAEIENVRHEVHPGRGWIDDEALTMALSWFEEPLDP